MLQAIVAKEYGLNFPLSQLPQLPKFHPKEIDMTSLPPTSTIRKLLIQLQSIMDPKPSSTSGRVLASQTRQCVSCEKFVPAANYACFRRSCPFTYIGLSPPHLWKETSVLFSLHKPRITVLHAAVWACLSTAIFSDIHLLYSVSFCANPVCHFNCYS